jgi:hypothetical protein
MFVKIRSSNFIDALQLEVTQVNNKSLRGVLKDEKGSVCRVMERDAPLSQNLIFWPGLNDLPYGQYTLEISQGSEEMKMQLVKRI